MVFCSPRCMLVSLTPGFYLPSLLSLCLLFQHFLCSSSRDREGKAKDEKGENNNTQNINIKPEKCFFPFGTIWSIFSFMTVFWKMSSSGVLSSNSSTSRNIWVSGLSSNTKAADLKNLFGKYGKVNKVHLLRICHYVI